MSSLWQHILLAIIGLGGGLAVGSGFVAFITVLDIIPRLAQLTNAHRYIRALEWSLVSGALFFTLADFFQWVAALPILFTSIYGVFAGVFVGTLAAGLTEALNVFPILAKRLNMDSKLIFLLMAMVLGKIIGSLLQWWLKL
ncbi:MULTISPECIES: stage V sporulation protein AB [Brevibacillus]|jgi:stage V sporulation protein AB|uniref:Stage V sporulation protein AB n=2 Tax=Bacillati TaxID=1783272 RepID=M8E333_9BACL|nr:stage V sporulation protein AB [Brevibacillus borstelensis]EMT53671.1 stage V sporulation protein AB [Brevibacillus borstelensis AK1]KKX56912.1 stage V sporulation protein AB [Brevibacillus borstelensis cifa_chp40]MBE5397719.1 stage V sporulation protein AB [Brevibacillus borstelensis]MCC0562657.1 stage V sporulation protein AB [Brevibacillus borstelensis]MCM3469735.1 stage V sporulation protein AB [Brevibacillus borstelensis]